MTTASRSTESWQVVAALEEVLEVPPGTLISLLPHPVDGRPGARVAGPSAMHR